MAVCHAEGRRDQLVMARNGDAARMHPTIAARDSFGSHLKVRGDGHPKSAAVLTPAGRLGSIAEMKHYEGVVPEPMGWQVFVVTDGERKPPPLRSPQPQPRRLRLGLQWQRASPARTGYPVRCSWRR